jgi:hypothetical protein
MSSSVASWFAPACVALGLMLVAGSAHAQFDECVVPSSVPEAVFNTILDEASFGFGGVPDKVCNSIVKKGISTCKAQVKAAAKCFDRAFNANYAISVKQCQQLESSEDRSECKAESKAIRDDGKGEVELSKDSGLDICEGEFEESLSDACLLAVMPI